MKRDESHQPNLPLEIEKVIIDNGRAIALADPVSVEKGLAVRVGTAVAPLLPVHDIDESTLSYLKTYRPAFHADDLVASIRPKKSAEEVAEVSLNKLQDWCLPGLDTVQVKVTKPEERCRIALKDPITLSASTKARVFSARLAAHRGKGRLIVKQLASGDTQNVQPSRVFTFQFDSTKQGGTKAENYLHATCTLPPSDQDTELHFELAFDAFMPDESGMPPFMFLSDPVVLPEGQAASDQTALVFAGERVVSKAAWFQADIPAFLQPDTRMELLLGDQSYPIIDGSNLTVTLLEDHGHSLLFNASEQGAVRIFVDDVPICTINLGTEPTWVRIPTDLQTGGYRKVLVTDLYGLQKYFETYVLLPELLTPIDVLQRESRAPFPVTVMSQTRFRYDALKAQLAAGLDPDAQVQVAYCLNVVEGGFENVKLKPLKFPVHKEPDVSIVIPAHNKIEVTYLALASLLLAHNQATFEVIVVDDASTDETVELETFVEGITVIHNTRAQRFISACNAGAEKARGKYVMLLNNDVEVTNGFLDALIDAFEYFPNVGLVGSKLLYPNGKLQDAGGIIWGTGNPWNYGNGQNPWDPRFCYARQADYLTGAAMMTTKEIWDQLGGLSSYLEPMYFEDTDFSFKVREAGYRTYFVPSSIVYHFEGMTSGTDTSSGFKRYQEVNRPKFKRRWAADYAGFGKEGVMPDLEKDRGIVGRVLFIDYATPRPDRDAGSHAAIQEIRLVQALGYKVTFLPENLAHMGDYTEALEKMGVEVVYAPFQLSIAEYLKKHVQEFDAFFITRYYVAQSVLAQLRELAPRTPILFNNADLHFLRELRAALTSGQPDRLTAARAVREQELDIIRKVDVVLSYNEVEHAIIQSHTDGQAKVCKCPWVVEIPQGSSDVSNRSGLSFLGNFDHPPNSEGVIWFSSQVMPLLEVDHPELKLHIYGSKMKDSIKALECDTIRPEGFVADIADAYNRHRIFIAPLLSGAGIKGKVLAALAHGVPCVLSPIAAEGTGLRNGYDCLIAETPEEWRKAIQDLQTDDALWEKISANARDYVRENYDFEKGKDLMRAAFEAVGLYSPAE